jgi:hypothetical protein
LNSTPGMRRLQKLDNEAPVRREMMIVLATIYVIVVSILACELVTRVHDNNTETKSTYSRLRTYNV